MRDVLNWFEIPVTEIAHTAAFSGAIFDTDGELT